jgi:glycosyltransferase involved in cell wall biosynthesis
LRPHGVRFSAFAFDGWREDTLWTFCDELIDGRETTLAEVLMTDRYELIQCVDTAYSPPWGVEIWARRARFRGPIVLLGSGGERVLAEATHATHYIAVSETAAAVLAEDAAAPVAVIASGYDEEYFRPGPSKAAEGRPLLVWVGRSFDPVKDVELFLDLVELSPDHDAVLVDSTLEPSTDVASRLERIGVRLTHAAFLAPSEMAELYRRAGATGGAIVNTSRSEGFNCSIAEALACECPAVVPRIPGLAHLVDGTTAVTYDRADGARGAAAALSRLSDPGLRASLVAEGRRQAELRWAAHSMADDYLELYREALAAVATASLAGRLLDRLARVGWRSVLGLRPYWRRLRARTV